MHAPLSRCRLLEEIGFGAKPRGLSEETRARTEGPLHKEFELLLENPIDIGRRAIHALPALKLKTSA
jgi:hypothetical protein